MGGEGYYVMWQTPDGGPVGEQDAHFMRCLDTIAGTWNQKINESRNRA
jgi:hypothetical protein